MNIPSKFKFYVNPRCDTEYTAEVDGDKVVVTWTEPEPGSTEYAVFNVQNYISYGDWTIAEDLTPKEDKLPDNFKVVNNDSGIVVTATKVSDGLYRGDWEDDGEHLSFEYTEQTIKDQLSKGYLKMLQTYKYPEKFVATYESGNSVYYVTRQANGTYTWEGIGPKGSSVEGSVHEGYTESSIDAFIEMYAITEVAQNPLTETEACSTVEPDLLSKIQQFTANVPADVIIDKKGFSVQYNDYEPIRVANEQELLELFCVIEKFHNAFNGK